MIYKFDFCEAASLELTEERFKNAENVYFGKATCLYNKAYI